MRLAYFSILLGAILLSASYLGVAQTHKQAPKVNRSEETIVINKDKNSSQTVVEIDGKDVYVNNKKVFSLDNEKQIHEKIIIRDDNNRSLGIDDNGRRHALLGVYTDPEAGTNGAYIKSVGPSSPAEAAGLKEGDIILKVDGNDISSYESLVQTIRRYYEGDTVSIVYERNNKRMETTAVLDGAPLNTVNPRLHLNPMYPQMPGAEPFSFDYSRDFFQTRPKLGITGEDNEGSKGVKVVEVKPNSPAAHAGLQAGDVITNLNGSKLASVSDLEDVLDNADTHKKLKLQYVRKGESFTTDISFANSTRRDL